MTLQQKRRAMAEACPGIFMMWGHKVRWRDTIEYVTEREWLYAVHAAEGTLTPDQEEAYVECLSGMIMDTAYEKDPRYFKSNLCSRDSTYRATEPQRLDAFLKVKGLWREGE